ncbi:putative MFS-type transporter YusP [Zancudomyces culisetae]|uniref:Putative MFS-type transporter YusP n=1 Tax=Zancudomyces culisetae TaxID=1213189 RepID=A0A1R1PIH0_ZANCU|nr:putative MFS-type transporter YusP [Zancudomyces culisetae]OMH80805.1 putative MFS-type transporter YusP [Zancudomyces culisetae]|eukprot:OMH79070.1 putative MFS-type transporter YusP [Zancudomyces culisetae]
MEKASKEIGEHTQMSQMELNEADESVELSTVDSGHLNKVTSQPENDQGQHEQLSPRSLWFIIGGLATALFLAALDNTIVSTAMPTIAQDFNSLSSVSWVATSYMLTSTSLQPLYGTLADIFGKKVMLLFSIVVFELGSLLCGLSNSMIMLIIFRGLSGVGGAGIFVMVMLCISDLVPIPERGRYMGVLGGVFGVSSIAGPLLGGLFTDKVSWRWCFYINLPLGVISLVVVVFLIKLPGPRGALIEKIKRIDFLGAFVFVAALMMILLALNWGGSKYAWDSGVTIGLLVGGAALLVVFVGIELKISREPMINLKLFTMQNPLVIITGQFFMGFTMFTTIFYMPIYYHVVYNGSATAQGLFLLPFMLSIFVGATSSGIFSSKTAIYRPVFWLGMLLLTIGTGLYITLTESSSRFIQALFMVIAGIGLGFCIQLMLIAGQASVPRNLITGVTTLITFIRIIGGTIGLAICSTIFNQIAKNQLTSFALAHPQYAELSVLVINNSSHAFDSNVPQDIRVLIIKCFMKGIRSVYLCSTIASGIGFLVVLFTKTFDVNNPKAPAKNVNNTSSNTNSASVLNANAETKV